MWQVGTCRYSSCECIHVGTSVDWYHILSQLCWEVLINVPRSKGSSSASCKMNEDKKATFFIRSLAGGGAEGVCVNVANGLVERGWNVDILVLNLRDADYKGRVSKKVRLVSLDVMHARSMFFSLKKYLDESQPKKILVFNYELAVILVLFRFALRYKYRVVARNINTFSAKLQQVKRSGLWQRYVVGGLIRLLYTKVDHVVNQCEAMEVDILKFYPMLGGRTSVIYNPVARYIEEYAVANDGVEPGIREKCFLCVGRLEEQKSFNYAILAFSEVVKKHPDYVLRIVGKGRQEKSLKQLVSDLNIEKSVFFEGFQKNLIPYYLGAQATVLTSQYEGFPNVLIESITLGTPVISFDCPSGPSEIIVSKVNGLLVEHLNVRKLVKAWLELCSGTPSFDRRSVSKTAKIYNSQTVVGQYESLLLRF